MIEINPRLKSQRSISQIKGLGKLVLMLCSIIACVLILEPLLSKLGPTYSLYSRRDFGKIVFLLIVIAHFAFIIFCTAKSLLSEFVENSFGFFYKDNWFPAFFKSFSSASLIFSGLFAILLSLGFIQLTEPLPTITNQTFLNLAIATLAAFTLAWSEEMIFRAGLFKYFEHHGFSPISGAILTSIIFSLSHNLKNPFSLIWPNWQLGLGLFLLGLLLNLLFIASRKLYVNMGFHAGLVFAGRVIYRSWPFYFFVQPLPWWLNQDLRSSALVQTIFVIIILGILFTQRKIFFPKALAN